MTADLAPMFVEARAKGLWFYVRYQGLWFSPDELELARKAGRFQWSADNWVLRDPAERVTELARNVQKAREELQTFITRIGKGGSWRDKVEAERKRRGRSLTVEEMLTLAKTHEMTPEEIEAQRQSWARQDMD